MEAEAKETATENGFGGLFVFHTTLPELLNYFRYFKLARMCYTMLRFFWRLGNSGKNGRADLSQNSTRRLFSPFSGTMPLHIRIT
jgi:hypothetical protein